MTSHLDQLTIDVELEAGRALVRLEGELDPHTAPLLKREIDQLAAAGTTDVVLDMSQLQFIDSSGLRVVISAHRELAEQGGRLALRAPSETALRLLEITGLVDHIDVLES